MKKEQLNTADLDLSSTTGVLCEECGNHTFKPIFFLRKISRFLTGEDADKILPIDSLACVKCNHVNPEFAPPIVKQESNKQKSNKQNKKEDE
jgi:hypothetical protein